MYELKILFVGNSLLQDAISYLPYMLKTYYPQIHFKFYVWYVGGFDLSQHYGYFQNGTSCEIFSKAENVSAWTNSTDNMAHILSTYTFDIVCMQEYFNYKSSYTSMTDWNNCKNYIESHYAGDNNLRFVSFFHAPLRSNKAYVFSLTKRGNRLIHDNGGCDYIVPAGIAVYRAISSSLGSLGDQGQLSTDGTHTQEGLPCLIQTFVVLQWVLEMYGLSTDIYGNAARMTTAIYNTLNVPGANPGSGVITGTDEQNLLAQEIAMKAFEEGKIYMKRDVLVTLHGGV